MFIRIVPDETLKPGPYGLVYGKIDDKQRIICPNESENFNNVLYYELHLEQSELITFGGVNYFPYYRMFSDNVILADCGLNLYSSYTNNEINISKIETHPNFVPTKLPPPIGRNFPLALVSNSASSEAYGFRK